MLTPISIEHCYERIKKNLLETPLVHSVEYSSFCHCQLYLKLENLQKTGSFKVLLLRTALDHTVTNSKIRGSSNMVMKRIEAGLPISGPSSNRIPDSISAISPSPS